MNKYFLTSKRIWGIIITAATAVVPVVSKYLGHEISPAAITQLGDSVTAAINAVGAAVGIVLAFWGSVVAQGPVVFKRPQP
jgi:hypothetical protein